MVIGPPKGKCPSLGALTWRRMRRKRRNLRDAKLSLLREGILFVILCGGVICNCGRWRCLL